MSVQINVQASQSALAQSIAQGVAAFNSRYAGQNQLNLQINARAFSQPLGRITSDLADFESALKASNARVLAFGASTAVLGGVVRSFKEIANVTIEVEKSLTDINRVLNLSTNNLQKFSSELFSISKQTASSFDDATKAALEFSRQGLNTEETLKRTADALTLVRLTGISSTKAVEDLTATINGFAKAGLTTSQVVNKLAAVEQDFAVSATDLTEALSRTGQAAQEAGVSFDELNALVTTAQQNTARGGAVIGNALKTIFTRLQRTETLDQLENFNIAVRDVQGNILPAVQILKNFADQYNNLADAQRAQLSEQVAGVYQVNILKGVIKDLNNSQGTYVQALERGAMAANEADIANEKLNKTLSALVTQTGVGLQQLANNVGKVTFAPIFEAIVSPVNDAVSYINDTLEGEGIGSIFANGLLKGVRNVIAGPGLAVAFAVIAKVAKNTFEDATKALPAILGLTTEAQKRANIEKSIISILQTQSNLSLALQGQQGNLSSQAATVLNYARLQTAQYQQQLQIAQQLAPLLAAQNVTVGSRGIQVGPKIKAGGHIPAFAEMSERMGAAMGGYKSGKVVKAPTSVGANTYMNSAEEVKYVSGFAQPFINPPANSKAGRKHRQNAIKRTGIDPYMASGFIPNFSNAKNVINTSFLGKLNELQITSNDEKREIQRVADLETTIRKGKKIEVINDNIVGKGIRYDIQQYKGLKTNKEYREEAAKLALNGKIDQIANAMPQNKKSLFNGDQWKKNLQILKDNNIDLTNNALLSTVKLGVPSLSTGKTTEFGKQFTGLLNALSGEAFERDISQTEKKFSRSAKGNARLDFISKDEAFSGGEAKLGNITLGNLVAKAIESTGRTYENGEPDLINFSKPIKLFVPAKHKLLNKGFIPNFATPLSTARIPWFKKYSSKYKNIAGDTDLFKMGDFPTYGRGLDHEYAKKGNSSMLSYLHEDFVRSAINIALGSKKVIRPSEVGFKNKPISEISNENDFDLLYKLADGSYSMLELKQDFKNISGSITGFMNKKLENLKKENPELAKKVSSMIAVSNMPKFIDPTGKNPAGQFSEFEMAISSIVKDKYSNVDPTISAKLTKVTDGLLRRYEAKKNTNSRGFIPNFAYKQSVMALEEGMSGNKAIFDTKPFPHIRNSSQPTFSSAISDHGGLKNALSDSMRNQEAVGLMSKGFVPNFAVVKARESLGADFGSLSKAEQTLFLQLNIALTRLTKDTTLTSQQQQALQNTIQNNALMLQQSTKSIKIVNDANDALVLALQQNAQAQTTAAQTAAVPSGPKRAEQTLSTRIGGLLGGARGAVRGRRFDRMLGGLSNNVGFTLAAPMVGGILESAIAGGKDRSEMGYGQRLASTGISGALTGLSTGASIGSAIPGIGTAAGAAIGAIVGFGGAVANARTTLDDLSKSIENVLTRNKNDIELAKTIADLEKQLSVENDPLNIEILKMKIADSAEKIKDTKFSEKILQSSKSIDDFDKAIKQFTLQKKSIESLQKLPSAILAFSKETKTPESKYDIPGLLSVQQSLFETKGFSAMFDKEEFKKINKRAQTLAPAYFKSFGNELLNLEQQVIEKAPNLSGNIKDIISNLNKYRKSGELENKLSPLVKAGVIDEEYSASFVNVLETVSNVFFDSYLNNIDTNLNNLKNTVQKEAKASAERVADMDTVKNVFATINNSIQNALTDYAIQLSNIDFAANVGKLNLEKTGNIFETAASAIGKNLQDIAKNQLDFLISQMDVMRQNNLLDIQATQFQQSREIQQKTFLTERKSRISAFLEPNIVNAPDSRGLAEQALSEIGENLNYDFKNLNSLSLKFSAEVQRSLNTLIEDEKRKQKTFSNDRANAATLFNLEQQYAKNLISLKDKTAKLDLELQQKTYANLLKEKQVIESFNFDAQALQIRTQAQIERMSIPMNVNPNFFAGATRFQQEDYKFRLDQEKERKQLAASLRSASNEAVLADFRSRILDSNTKAINDNVEATRNLTIALYKQKSDKLTEVQTDLSKQIENLASAPKTLEQISPIKTRSDYYNFDTGFRAYNSATASAAPAFTYDQNLINQLNVNKNNAAIVDENKPLPFYKQLWNAWTGNAQKNQLPVEQRSVQEIISGTIADTKVDTKLQKDSDFRFYKEKNKSLSDLVDEVLAESSVEASTPAQITNPVVDQSRIDALKQQAESTKKAKEETNSYILSLEKLNEKRFAMQSEVAAATPYTSTIKSLEEEKMIFDQSLQILTTREAELKKQSETVMTEAERVQLNDKLFEVSKQINNAKGTQLKFEEAIKKAQEEQKNYMDYMASRGKFMTGVRKATAQMQEEISMFGETLGGTITTSFRDGLVGAMNAAANETDNLESALLNVATNFLKAIQNAMFTQIANQITTSLFPTGPVPTASQRGGIIRAQSGMYISGGRTGDKNPALLEDGEYVLNRNAVKALGGPRAIDQLNFNAFPRFATGGDPGTMSASVSMSEPFERLSMYGREQSPEYQSYLERLREEEAAREKKRAERKALLNQFIGTLISTGISMGLSSAVGAAKEASMAKANLKGATGTLSNGTTTQVTSFADAKNLINSGGSVTLANGSTLTQANFADGFSRGAFNQIAAARFAESGIKINPGGLFRRSSATLMGKDYANKTINERFANPAAAFGRSQSIYEFSPYKGKQKGGIVGFNQGGFLPYGSRLTDSIPAYLTGGEYVINSRAVRKYGVGGLNRINSGVARFQDGGMVGDGMSPSSNSSNTSNSNISINITVNANNGKVGDQESDSNGDNTESNSKELSNRIKAVVLDVITTEQRSGGLLDSTKKK